MSPTRRQLLAGLFGAATVAALPAVTSTDTHAHPHSAGRHQETLDAESQRERDAFDGLDELMLFALVPNPHRERDGARRVAVTLHVENGELKVACPGDPEFYPARVGLVPDLTEVPDWMARPIGEFILAWEARS